MDAASVAGLVLAAGRSRRMGGEGSKLTSEIDGQSLVRWPVDALLEAGVDPLLVVTGFDADRVEASLSRRACEFVRCADWTEGMGASLACGARALMARREIPQDGMRGVSRTAREIAGVLVCVGDLPGLRAAHVAALLEAIAATRDAPGQILVPVWEGRRGHPVFFGRTFLPDLAALGGASGARAVLERHAPRVHAVAIDSDGILVDVDTPADLDRWRSRTR